MERGGRILAAVLAAVWLAAGLTARVVGLWLRPAIVLVLLGPLALGYGWIWARVAVTGFHPRVQPRGPAGPGRVRTPARASPPP